MSVTVRSPKSPQPVPVVHVFHYQNGTLLHLFILHQLQELRQCGFIGKILSLESANPFIRKCVNKGQTVLFAKNRCCTALAFG